jgi:two-component system sensor histidine kinase DctS
VIKSVHDFVRRRDQAREAVRPPQRWSTPCCRWCACRRASWRRVELRHRRSRTCPRAVCDRTMVEQVLLNLARNGMQAMDDGHTPLTACCTSACGVRVQRRHSGWVEFRWRPRPGIPPEVAQRLFTPFFTTKPRGHGPGPEPVPHGGGAARRVLGFAPNEPRGTVFTVHPAGENMTFPAPAALAFEWA